MEDKREILDPADQEAMHDMFEALVDFIGGRDVHMNVIMHALCRTLAYGGMQLNRYDKVTKRQFVSMVVESTSAHYDSLARALEQSGERDD